MADTKTSSNDLFKDINKSESNNNATPKQPEKPSELVSEPMPNLTAPVTQTAPVKPFVAPTTPITKAAPPEVPEDELQIEDPIVNLKARATMMGLKIEESDTVESLRVKIEYALNPPKKEEAAPMSLEGQSNIQLESNNGSELSPRQRAYNEAMKLVRVRIQNLNPRKADLPGEIFTIANDFIGTVKKYIPYGEASEGGYHIPNCIYENLKERTFQNIQTKTNKITGKIDVTTKDAKEFALELLPPLTEAELARLATAQIAAGSVDA